MVLMAGDGLPGGYMGSSTFLVMYEVATSIIYCPVRFRLLSRIAGASSVLLLVIFSFLVMVDEFCIMFLANRGLISIMSVTLDCPFSVLILASSGFCCVLVCACGISGGQRGGGSLTVAWSTVTPAWFINTLNFSVSIVPYTIFP